MLDKSGSLPSGQLAHGTAPAVPREVVEAALARTHKDLGTALSEEQREAALGICTSGRGAEIVIGVAGAGKTTMLRAVAEAFERSGHQVLGTATSGQAAHNLAREAGIGESRTLASLIWRLEGAILERRRVVEELAARNERQVSRERLMAERGQTIERAASGLSMALDGYYDRSTAPRTKRSSRLGLLSSERYECRPPPITRPSAMTLDLTCSP